MLSELKVSNFAIIDRVSVFFKPGFNVLSGETGSGKSVLLKSLALLMGEKSATDTIKSGAEQAAVEGSFDISQRKDIRKRLIDLGIEASDDILVVKRIISSDGKNRVYINGSLSTLHQLRDIVAPLIEVTGHPAPLIEMTGQHENRHLQSRSYHLESLDQYIGALSLRKQVEDLYHEREKLENQLQQLSESARMKSQRLDFLTFQRDEIKSLGLKPGDEIELETQIQLLKNSSRLTEFIDSTESALYSDDDSALVRIHRTLQKSLELTRMDQRLTTPMDHLQQAKALIEECMYGLREYSQKISSDPSHLERLEDQMNQLRKLQKKYGTTVDEILSALTNIESEIAQLENFEESQTALQNQISALTKKLTQQASELHSQRAGGAATLAKSVNAELEDLNMKGLIFHVQVQRMEEGRFTPTGVTDVEFMIQSSQKDQPRSLARFASGGELSRILLSLKRVTGSSEYPRTHLFDEVDAGVSGRTAEKVGRKLRSIAKGQQVISVTHLPQVAAFAHAHYVISKSARSGEVHMHVEELAASDKVREIARMLSGEKITKTSLDHAKELLGV